MKTSPILVAPQMPSAIIATAFRGNVGTSFSAIVSGEWAAQAQMNGIIDDAFVYLKASSIYRAYRHDVTDWVKENIHYSKRMARP